MNHFSKSLLPAKNVTEPFLKAKNLSLHYGKRCVLRDVSFDLQPGETLGLLGPNGSGKSSLFQILTALRAPSEGILCVEGVDVRKNLQMLRKMNGVVFQSSSLDIKLSVWENLWIFGLLQGVARSVLRTRIAFFIERFALDGRQYEKVETLSGGLRRRVELMMAILNKPALLLLDEPTTGLDLQARTEFWRMVHTLCQEDQTSVICASHNFAETATFQKILLLHEGKQVAYDTPQNLKQKLGHKVIRVKIANPKVLQTTFAKKLGWSCFDAKGKLAAFSGRK